jgi:8-oxo-dGTP pyrophosphatase MutT (NUDIX family)
MDVAKTLGVPATRVSLDSPKVYHIPGWGDYLDPKRMDIIARIAKERGRDPRIATKAVEIIKAAGAQPRNYKGQSAALLKFVQSDLYYVNEPGERLVDPLRTIALGYGDCDDLVMVLASLLESIRMPWRLAISGTTKSGKKVRFVQGDKFPKSKGIKWSHIYLAIGDRPFKPSKWYFAETTVRGAPLGWDVVDGSSSLLPEMNNYGATMPSYFGASMQMPANSPTTHISRKWLNAFRPTAFAPLKPSYVTTPSTPGIHRAVSWAAQAPHAQRLRADMVAIIVRRPDGRILALQRSGGMDWMPNRWDLPGGKTRGLFAKDAAAKILAAETGIKVDPRQLRGCSTLHHPAAGSSMFLELRLPTGAAEKYELTVNEPEHAKHAWVTPHTLLRTMSHVPYIGVALRACHNPASLATGFRGHPDQSGGGPIAGVTSSTVAVPGISLMAAPNAYTSKYGPSTAVNMSLLGAYGEDDLADDLEDDSENLLMKKYYGVPVWAAIAVGGAAYMYRGKLGIKKRKNPRRRKNTRRKNSRKARRNSRRR